MIAYVQNLHTLRTDHLACSMFHHCFCVSCELHVFDLISLCFPHLTTPHMLLSYVVIVVLFFHHFKYYMVGEGEEVLYAD